MKNSCAPSSWEQNCGHADLLHKVAGLCNNANQLAKIANTYGEASQQDIEGMTKLARQVWEEVKNNW